jgi:hypothetical protein
MATAPAVQRVRNFNLVDTMAYQRQQIQQRKASLLGRVMNIRLGIDDNAEYFRGEAWKRVARSSRMMGLTLEWKTDEAPVLGHAEDRQTAIFMDGIQNLPTVAAHVLRDAGNMNLTTAGQHQLPRLPQRLSDFSSGRIMGRDGSGFLVLQPVEQIAILAYGISTMLILRGRQVDGRYPCLLVNPHSPEAYIAGGMLTFD